MSLKTAEKNIYKLLDLFDYFWGAFLGPKFPPNDSNQEKNVNLAPKNQITV